MTALDPRIDVIREKYGLERSDFWELPQKKGTWVAKHSALEIAAAKAGIEFENPIIVEASSEAGIAVLSVAASMYEDVPGEESEDKGTRRQLRREWSIGEASPKNNRNAYPWAMAEKRAKDRVILKLIGIHGLVYSEDEMAGSGVEAPATPNLKRDLQDSVALEKAASKDRTKWGITVEAQREIWAALRDELDACPSVDTLAVLWQSKQFQDEFKKIQPGWQELLVQHKDELKAGMQQPVAPNFDNMERATQ